jgi:hypothetical protein
MCDCHNPGGVPKENVGILDPAAGAFYGNECIVF